MAYVFLPPAQLEGHAQSDYKHRAELFPLPRSNELIEHLRDDELERPPYCLGAPQYLQPDMAHHTQRFWAPGGIRLQLAASDGAAWRLRDQLLRGAVR